MDLFAPVRCSEPTCQATCRSRNASDHTAKGREGEQQQRDDFAALPSFNNIRCGTVAAFLGGFPSQAASAPPLAGGPGCGHCAGTGSRSCSVAHLSIAHLSQITKHLRAQRRPDLQHICEERVEVAEEHPRGVSACATAIPATPTGQPQTWRGCK
eukprot:170709-Rhodomonas_salina.1